MHKKIGQNYPENISNDVTFYISKYKLVKKIQSACMSQKNKNLTILKEMINKQQRMKNSSKMFLHLGRFVTNFIKSPVFAILLIYAKDNLCYVHTGFVKLGNIKRSTSK